MKKKEKLKSNFNINRPVNLAPNPINNIPTESIMTAIPNVFGINNGPLNSFWNCHWTGSNIWGTCNFFHCENRWDGQVMDLSNCNGSWTVHRWE
jgi:hypothetical protein